MDLSKVTLGAKGRVSLILPHLGSGFYKPLLMPGWAHTGWLALALWAARNR